MAQLAFKQIKLPNEQAPDIPQNFSLPVAEILGFTYDEGSTAGYIHYRYIDGSAKQLYSFVVRRADSKASMVGEELMGSFYFGLEGVPYLVFRTR